MSALTDHPEGEPLDERLRRAGGRLSLRRALELARQAAEALCELNDRNHLHGDLRPGTVLLRDDPAGPEGLRVSVLRPGPGLLRDGRLGEAAAYMAPEQCRPGAELTPKVDVYALGAVLYRALSGRPPPGPSPSLQSLPFQVPPELLQLVHAMMAWDPAWRPAMREVAEALRELQRRAFLSGQAPASRPAIPARRRPRALHAALALSVVLWFGLWIAWALGRL